MILQTTQISSKIDLLTLEEQLADPTSKTLHSGNSKSKDTSVQGLNKSLKMPVSIFKDIL